MTQKSDPGEVRRGFGPLFEPQPKALSHRSDPQTSRDAARRVNLGGAQRYALNLVYRHAGSTTKELAVLGITEMDCGCDMETLRQRIGRRLNELEKAGLIYREGVRDGCSIWYPKKEEADADLREKQRR